MRHYPGSELLSNNDSHLRIRLDNDNPHDVNAVAVYANNTKKCGYLVRRDALLVRKLMKRLHYDVRVMVEFVRYYSEATAILRLHWDEPNS